MRSFFSLLLAVSALFSLFACSRDSGDSGTTLNPQETFTDEDRPESFTSGALTFTGPWGYGKAGNENRLYPLIVVGYWGEGSGAYSAVAKDYPAFVLDYQKNAESDGAALADWITAAGAEGFRIDANRIYLIGFSMGGSGSYPLARGMFNKGMYFAAINRVAGQSEPDLTDAIASKTAVWYHIGLQDTETRISVARSALEYMRGYSCSSGAVETTQTDTLTGYSRTSVTLRRHSIAIFKYSEYDGMGHDPSAVYRDPAVFPWIFSQTLLIR